MTGNFYDDDIESIQVLNEWIPGLGDMLRAADEDKGNDNDNTKS